MGALHMNALMMSSEVWTVSDKQRQQSSLPRILDVVLSLLALAFLSPVLVALALVVYLSDGGPALFGQMRLGHDGRRFRCWKFRSMRVDAEERLQELLSTDRAALIEWQRNHKLRFDPRITPLGRFLRESSLDELPQLWNVLKGDMSLVGPRPIVDAEAQRYGRYFTHYGRVKPGLTGLWQISGRSDVSYRRRVAMDVLYVRRRSTVLYLRILVATVPAVLLKRGAV